MQAGMEELEVAMESDIEARLRRWQVRALEKARPPKWVRTRFERGLKTSIERAISFVCNAVARKMCVHIQFEGVALEAALGG